jgi:dipeptidase E
MSPETRSSNEQFPSLSVRKLPLLLDVECLRHTDPRQEQELAQRTPRGGMKLLLTSAGIKNTSIHDALVDLLGKPIDQSNALCIPTATYAFPGGAAGAWRLISGRAASPLCELGWKSLGVLELTALPSIERSIWIDAVEETDALLVGGGDPLYLCYWIEQSGLGDLLPSLSNMVWVGVSAGSLVMGPQVGQGFVSGSPVTTGDDRLLGLVDFAMFPHLNHEAMPDFSMAAAELWAAGLTVPAYAIDDETAIKVVGRTVEVVSEGKWQLFNARANAREVS